MAIYMIKEIDTSLNPNSSQTKSLPLVHPGLRGGGALQNKDLCSTSQCRPI